MNRGLGFQDGVGRVWRSSNAHLNIFLLLRCVGKRNLPHEMELPRWQVAGTQEGSKWSMGRGLGSQELGIGLGWFRKGQNKAWKGVWVFKVPKSVVGRVSRQCNAHLNNFLLLRCVGKRNLAHEMGLPRWQLAGTQEGSKWSMGRGLVCESRSSGNWNGDLTRSLKKWNLGCLSWFTWHVRCKPHLCLPGIPHILWHARIPA